MVDGLEGVIAAHTVLSDVDGAAGHLVIRGYSLDQLAGQTLFAAAIHLLLDGFFDDLPDVSGIEIRIGQARVEVFAVLASARPLPACLNGIEAVRALIALLPDGDDLDTAIRLLAGTAVCTAAVGRIRMGLEPVAPDPTLDHAADTLRMLRGAPASQVEASALDTYLVTVCDHGLNASTFAARVTASTLAGLTSAVLAGISTLKGPLHGGAPGPVIEMLDQIGDAANARCWLENALDQGDRLMGFGHRIYRVRDPRADALKRAVRTLNLGSGRLAFAEAVESAALAVLRDRKPGRSLQTNVEFYTALLLEALGFAPDDFTCVFAMGRTLGWLAHAREQVTGGRLIRPASVYVGPSPKLAA
jgi:citrate synthase